MNAETRHLAIETFGLTKIFRDFWGHARVAAVDGLDLQIHHREVFGLLGPNGSGKSTTIKMLLGLLFPTRGRAAVLNCPPGDVVTNRRIGYLPEESHLYSFLNARETLDFYGRLFNLTRAERRRRIDSLLEMVGLSAVARRPVGEYSKGMARRIGLAQALINDPDLLILDEPTSGLDPIGTRQIKDLIQELGRRGKTVLLSSHLLADVEDVCDRVCILYGGKTQASGRVDELLAQEGATQIRTRRLAPDTLAQVQRVVTEAEGADAFIGAETPRVKLEQFFLQTVEAAQAAQQETGGATMGAPVSDFLQATASETESGGSVIEQLVVGETAATEQPAPETAEQDIVKVEPVETVDTEVLQDLVQTEAITPEQSQQDTVAVDDTTPVTPTDEAAVDRSVIEGLLKSKTPPAAEDTDPEQTKEE